LLEALMTLFGAILAFDCQLSRALLSPDVSGLLRDVGQKRVT
jgi:hypothetical protein